MNTKRKALIACATHWESPFRVGSGHIASMLAKRDWEIAFLSNPLSPWQMLRGADSDFGLRLMRYVSGGRRYDNDQIWTYVPASFVTPHNAPVLKSDWVMKNWFKLCLPDILSSLKKNGFGSVDLLYFDNPQYHFLLDKVSWKRSVHRVTDNHSTMPYWTASMNQAEREVIRQVDLTVYSASSLEKYVRDRNPKKSMLLPNGVYYEAFESGSKVLPSDLREISGPIAIYVGAIKKRFDFGLLRHLARELSEVNFVLIGPDDVGVKELSGFPNVYLLGSKKFEELPPYLYNAHVGIIPYSHKYSDLVNGVNPLKLYEYFSCGLPVVATKWEELVALNSPAILAANYDEFVHGINLALSHPTAPAQLMQFAQQRSWASRVDELLSALNL